MTQEIGNSELFDTWASSGGVTAPDSGKNDEGWLPAERPPFQIMNYLFNMQQQKINHILKNGIPLWNDTTEYLAGAVVIDTGVAYRSTATNTNSQPPSGNWEKLAPDAIKNTVTAADPDSDNDNTEGYETFSRWVNSSSGEAFVCISAGTGAAVWENATLTAEDLGAAAFKGFLTDISGTVTNDDAAGALAIKNEIAAQAAAISTPVLLRTKTASNDATIDFDDSDIDSTYTDYLIKVRDLVPASDGETLRMRTSNDDGATYDNGGSDYSYTVTITFAGSSSTNVRSNLTASEISLSYNGSSADVGNAAGESLHIDLTLLKPHVATRNTKIIYSGTYDNESGELTLMTGTARRSAAEVVDALQFYMSSGNITSGVFELWGIP